MLAAQAGSSVLKTALIGVLAPVGAAGLVLTLLARPWRGRAYASSPVGPPLALALAFLAGFVVTHGWPRLAGASLRDELAWAGLVVGLLAAVRARHGSLPLLVLALLAALLPWILLDFQRRHWTRGEGILWSAGLGLCVFLSATWLAEEERRAQRAHAAVGWTLATALAAVAYGLSGSVQVAQLAGGLAAGLGVCTALALWRRTAGLGPAGVAPFVVLYLGLTWCGRFISELSLPGFVLLTLAPLAVLAARLVPGARPRLAQLVTVLGPPLLALLAVWLERAQQAPSPYPY